MTDMAKINDAALRVAHLATKTFEGITEQPTLDRAIVDMGKLMDKLDDEIVLGAMSRLGLEPEDVAAEDGAPTRWNMVDEQNAFLVRMGEGQVVNTGDGNAHILMTHSTADAMGTALPNGYIWCRSDLCHSTPVLADLHTDDYAFNRKVDIRPWLQTVAGHDLAWLIQNDWMGSTERDGIAHHLERIGDPTAKAMFDYQNLVPTQTNGDTNGFEIDPDDSSEAIIAWMKLNRPDVELPDVGGMAP